MIDGVKVYVKNIGGYFTTEYEVEAPGFNRPWEECRGMGFSFWI